MTNGVTFTPFSLNFFATTQGSLSHDSKPSVIKIIKFRARVSGKSPDAASKERAIGVAPFPVKPFTFSLIASILSFPKGTSNFVSLQSCTSLFIIV